MLRRTVATLLSSGVGLIALAAVPVATADPGEDIGLAGFRDIVVDDTHARVFLSQGTDQVVVTDLSGRRTGVVEGLFGAAGMALTEDDGTLFVALSSGDAIGVVDTETLEVDTVATGPDTCPRDLALAAGTVWFSQGCGSQGIGAMDPVDRSVHLGVSTLPEALLTSSPARPDELFVASYSTTYAFTATGGETPALTQRLARESSSWTADLAVTPDGSRLLTTASGRIGEGIALRTDDFSQAGNYRTGDNPPRALAIRDDGMVALGTAGIYDDDVFVMPGGSTTAIRTYEAGRNYDVLPRAMAFGRTRLYVVTGRLGDDLRLSVITPRRVSTLAVQPDRRRYGYGDEATVSVRLEGGETNREVMVYAEPRGQEPVLVATGEVPVGGAFVAQHPVVRATTFYATYAGDDAFDPDEDKAKEVTVQADLRTAMVRPRDTAGRYHLYRVGQQAFLRATMLPKGFDRCVTIRLQYFVRGQWGYDGKTSCLRLDRRSRAAGYAYGSPGLTGMPLRMRAEFRGDNIHAATKSPWSYLKFTR